MLLLEQLKALLLDLRHLPQTLNALATDTRNIHEPRRKRRYQVHRMDDILS